MKAGAVREARSPLKDAIDCGDGYWFSGAGIATTLALRNEDQEPLLEVGTPPPSVSGILK